VPFSWAGKVAPLFMSFVIKIGKERTCQYLLICAIKYVTVYPQFVMRFAVSMVNSKGKTYEETIIANNKKEAMWQAQDCNPYSTIIEVNWVYK